MPLPLPRDSERVLVLGRTGSGKTQAATFQLANRSITSKPWNVVDYKRTKLMTDLLDLKLAKLVDVHDKPPRRTGLNILRPTIDVDDEALEKFLWATLDKGGSGLYVDEGYMIGNRNRAFRALLTQGREKQLPMIVASQRPVFLDRFATTESEHIQVFHIHDGDDQKTIERYVDLDLDEMFNPHSGLPEFHSIWWDVKKHQAHISPPVPDHDTILALFDARLATRRVYV